MIWPVQNLGLNSDVISDSPSTEYHDMNLLSLNDDILVYIFSFLFGRDILHIALTSKRTHDLAIFRVASTAICRSPDHVTRMHEYMMGPTVGKTGRRARYLHMLNIPYVAFNLWYTQLPAACCVRDYYDAAHEAFAVDTSMTRLVGEVMIQAVNLRSLSIDIFAAFIKGNPGVRNALSSMTRLAN